MNNWVYKGFEKTYSDLGVSFDSIYYESDTYVSGKKIVEQGLKKKVFFQKKRQVNLGRFIKGRIRRKNSFKI
jgi:arginyl-tRNA synthetase